MTRTLLTLLCCALGAVGARAQVANSLEALNRMHERPAQRIIAGQIQKAASAAGSNLKTTGSGQQLVSNTITTPIRTDSMVHYWSNGRDLTHYPNPTAIIQDIFNGYSLTPVMPVEYFQEGNFATGYGLFMADSTEHYVTYQGNTDLYETISSQYNAFGKLERKGINPVVGLSNIQKSYVALQYDNDGNRVQLQLFVDSTNDGVDNYGTQILQLQTYSNGLLMEDSVVFYVPSYTYYYVHQYERDATGRDTVIRRYFNVPNQYSSESFYRHKYYPDGRLQTSEMYQVTPSLMHMWADSFGYTGNHPHPSFHENSALSVEGLIQRRATYTLNSAGNVQDYEINVRDEFTTGTNWVTVEQAQIYYNSYANPDSIITDRWQNSVLMPRYEVEIFRYQPTAIFEAFKPAEVSMAAYPNPAHNNVTLQLPQDARGTVGVYDAAGRLVLQYSHGQNGIKLDVKGLPVGMYVVRYNGSNGGAGSARFVKE